MASTSRNLNPLRQRWFLNNGMRAYFIGLPMRHAGRFYVGVWPMVHSGLVVNGQPTIVYRISRARRVTDKTMVRIAQRLVKDGLMAKGRSYNGSRTKPGVSYAGGSAGRFY